MIKLFTNYGLEKQAKDLYSTEELTVSKIVIGDANGTSYEPIAIQTSLVNQRAVLDIIEVKNPSDNIYQFFARIPTTENYTIREVGLIDDEDKLLWIAQCEMDTNINIDDAILENIIGIQIEVTQGTTIALADENILVASKNYVEENFQKLSEKGVSFGYCPLDGDSKIPNIHLPEYYTKFTINNGETNLLSAPGSGNITQSFVQPVLFSNGTLGADTLAVGITNPYSTATGAYKIFDGNINTCCQWKAPFNSSTEKDIIFAFNEPYVLSSLQFTQRDFSVRGFNIYVSNDGVTYTLLGLYSANGIQNSTSLVSINATTAYQYYKIRFTEGVNTYKQVYYICVYDLQISAYKIVSVSTADKLYCNIGNTHKTLTYTNTQGNTRTVNALQPISTTSLSNGTYSLVLPNKGNQPYLTNKTLYIQSDTPSSLVSGEIWFNTGRPHKTYICNGSNWDTEFEDVIAYGSEITVSDGVITSIKQPLYNKNGSEDFNKIKSYVVERYKSGTSWYRLYSDGWCEQGGCEISTTTGYPNIISTYFLKPFRDTNYNLQISAHSTGTAAVASVYLCINSKYPSYFTTSNLTTTPKEWYASGYVNV